MSNKEEENKIDELHEEMITLKVAREWNEQKIARENREWSITKMHLLGILLGAGAMLGVLADGCRKIREADEKMRLMECLESLEEMMKQAK